jgi:2-keto-4-pentenoate hydratase
MQLTEPDIARVEDLAQKLIAAYRVPAVPSSLVRDLTFEQAMAIQGQVLTAFGEDAAVVKVALNAEDRAIAAPIFSLIVVESGGALPMPAYPIAGLEVEVAVLLKADLTPEVAARGDDAVLAAIDHFLVGVEVIGSRLSDRNDAGLYGGLADSLSTAGYVHGAALKLPGNNAEGLPVEIVVEGRQIFAAPAKVPFGGALNVLKRYASAPADGFGGLKAGRIVTTGSLCGIVPIPGRGRILAKLGEAPAVEFTLG